ncbi:MAG TPA: hypothetical protein VMT03_24480 [Polyangia bacterium]|nr:hypothetical protein [Polyangia bacterium]
MTSQEPLDSRKALVGAIPMFRPGARELSELWMLLRRNARLLIICIGGATMAMAALTLLGRMTFRAKGSLYLGEVQRHLGAQEGLPEQIDFVGGQTDEIGTELAILQSDDALREAALRSGLTARIAPVGWHPPRFWRWLWARRDPRVLESGSRLQVTDARLATYIPEARSFQVDFASGGAFLVSGEHGPAIGRGQIGQPFSSDVVSFTITRSGATDPPQGASYALSVSPTSTVVEEIKHSLAVSLPKSPNSAAPGENVRIAAIEFLSRSPDLAVQFVDSLMRRYLERRQSWKTEEATQAETFIGEQVKSVKQALYDADKQLADYKQNSAVVVLGDDTTNLIEQTAQYEQQRLAAQMQVAAFDQVSGSLKKAGANLEQFLVGEASDPVLSGLSTNLAQARQDLDRQRQRFTDDAPEVREALAQVDGLSNSVRKYITSRRSRAQEQLASLDHLIAHFHDKMKTVPAAQLELAQLTRNADVLSKMYTFLLEHQEQATVGKAATMSRNHVLDSPQVSFHEDSPLLFLRLIGAAALGLIVAVIWIGLKRLVMATFETEIDLRRETGDLVMLGTIPKRKTAGGGLEAERARQALPFDLFAGGDPAFAESFRHLRASVYRMGANRRDVKVLLMTSPMPGDGKTLCTLSLAVALVADGKRVMVIEGDMHRPSHHRLFKQSPDVGLSSLPRRSDIVRTVSTCVGNFDAITAGSPSGQAAAELLSRREVGNLIAFARQNYDFVLVDSPPFPLLSDALILSRYVDGVVSIIRLQNTRRRAAEEHIRRFLANPVLEYGLVVNGIDDVHSKEYGYSAGKGYRPADGIARIVEVA